MIICSFYDQLPYPSDAVSCVLQEDFQLLSYVLAASSSSAGHSFALFDHPPQISLASDERMPNTIFI